MTLAFPKRLFDGYRSFRRARLPVEQSRFQALAESGQQPEIMVIGCCDSRVSPEVIFDAQPGELFVSRNVANLVPPYEPGGSFASVPAALEFAVLSLGIEHIIVLGHGQCGGIRALMGGTDSQTEFIGKWVGIARRARERVLAELPSKPLALQERACEQAGILVSLENLMTYPWIAQRVEAGAIHLHGWYFDIAAGALMHYEPARNAFEPAAPGAAI